MQQLFNGQNDYLMMIINSLLLIHFYAVQTLKNRWFSHLKAMQLTILG